MPPRPTKAPSVPRRTRKTRKVPSEVRKSFKYYKNFLYSKKVPFPCPECGLSIFAKDYEVHYLNLHGLNTLCSCVWCFGQVSWPARSKCLNTDHLLECCRKFLVLNVVRPTLPLPSASDLLPLASDPLPSTSDPPSDLPPFTVAGSVPFDRTPLCSEKDLFGRSPDLQPRVYEPVWPLPLSPSPHSYDVDSLNWAASCVRMYGDLKDDTYWCHAIVRSVAFENFLRAIDADEGRTRTLPFSCWCDGGRYEEAVHRQHRHMIAVAPSKDHFEQNVWKKIKIPKEDRPGRSFRSLHKDPVESALHLVHLLGYVSQRESICRFSGDTETSPESSNHYYIFHSLPKDYRLPLVLEWKNGLRQLLHQEFRNMRWGELIRTPMTFAERKWHIRIQHLPDLPFGKQLPFAYDRKPRPEQPLHLLRGRTLQVDPGDPSTRRVAFYDVVREEYWTPRPFHQRIINEFKPLLDRIAEVEAENTQLKRKEREQRDRIQSLQDHITQLEEKNRQALDTIHQLHGKIHHLNDKIHHLNEEHLTKLNEEKNALQIENNALRTEIQELKTAILRGRESS